MKRNECAKSLEIGEAGDAGRDGDRRTHIARQLVVDAQRDIGDVTRRAVSQRVGGNGSDTVSIVQSPASCVNCRARQCDGHNPAASHRRKLADIGDIILVLVLPDEKACNRVVRVDHAVAVEICKTIVGRADHAIMVAVEFREIRETAYAAVAEELRRAVDLAVAIQIACQDAVVLRGKGGFLGIEVAVDIKARLGTVVCGKLNPVAVKIKHKRVFAVEPVLRIEGLQFHCENLECTFAHDRCGSFAIGREVRETR